LAKRHTASVLLSFLVIGCSLIIFLPLDSFLVPNNPELNEFIRGKVSIASAAALSFFLFLVENEQGNN